MLDEHAFPTPGSLTSAPLTRLAPADTRGAADSAYTEATAAPPPAALARLLRLSLEGFKSFAKKTAFDFEPGITGIVGPNGCGKSNIVDAFRWVLGTQSAKALRGKEMLDVIYSGGTAGRPARHALVSLTFDNRDRYFNNGADEIEIGRKLTRQGESAYFLNGQETRLKDLKQLFLDTGLGVAAYSIIEQGRIDQLVTTDTQARRKVFEEAAGIAKFKAKRKETLSRLDRVEQNFTRLSDVLEEVRGTMRRVKSQATRAARYREYTQRLAELKVQRALKSYRELVDKREEHLRVHAAAHKVEVRTAAQHEERAKELAQSEAALETAQRESEGLQQQRFEVEKTIAARSAAVESHEQRLRELAEQEGRLTERIAALETTCADLTRRQQGFHERHVAIVSERDAVARQLEDLEAKEAQLVITARQEDEEITALKETVVSIARKQAALSNEVTALSGDIRMDNERLGRADRVLTELEARDTTLAKDLADVEARTLEIEGALDALSVEREALDAALAALEESRTRAREAAEALRVERSALQARHAALTGFLEAREGIAPAVRALLDDDARRAEFQAVGLLADLLVVAPADAAAVAAALGARADALVVESESAARALLAVLAEESAGGAHVLALDALAEAESGAPFDLPKGAVWARALVAPQETDADRLAAALDALLAATLVVDDVDAAVACIATLPCGATVVTRQGEIVRVPGHFATRPARESALAVRAEVERLKEALAACEARLDEAHAERDALERTHAERDADDKRLRTAIYEATVANQEQETIARHLKSERERLDARRQALRAERETAAKHRTGAEARQRTLSDRIAQSNDEAERLTAQIAERDQALGKIGAELQALRHRHTEQQIALAEVTQRAANVAETLAANQERSREAEDDLARARNDVARAEAQRAESAGTIERATQELTELRERATALAQAETTAVERLADSKDRIGALRGEVGTLAHELEDARGQRREAAALQQGLLEQLDELARRVREDLDLDIEEQLRLQPEVDQERQVVEAEIEDLTRKLRRLGNVNMEALGELEELEQRNTFLSEQERDLRAAKLSLTRLLERIDSQSKQRFTETFSAIREQFRRLFRKLFGGGQADVFLEDPEDLLGSGIEVVAKPPGKEPRTLTLLSGGERSLTALALLFAIFQAKPSPFCILDEVDAALDESNIGRFSALLQEFAERSQFLVITHSKPTMAAARLLYGVTMQEAGVSKRVAIQLAHVDELEAAPVA